VDAADRPKRDHGGGALGDCRYLLHDRDTKYTQSFRAITASGQVEPLVLPARSPNLNAYAERWVASVQDGNARIAVFVGHNADPRPLRRPELAAKPSDRLNISRPRYPGTATKG
jgi:hypothetical protein